MEGILAIIVGWVVVAAIIGLFKDDGKNKDLNYCRSVAAQYGQQGTNEFSNAYNACMNGKGW